jgi:alpha-L-fucosidase
MKISNKVISVLVIVSIFIINSGCSSSNTVKHDAAQDNWVLIDVDSTIRPQSFNTVFSPKHHGKFVVQLISSDSDTEELSDIKINDQTQSEVLTQKYVIDSGNVYEFSAPFIFQHKDQYTLSLTTPHHVKQIRIVPHYSNPIGSGDYLEAWLKMHQSTEKREALNWFKDARFGMFIHWGVYSQAGGIWNDTKIDDSPFPGPKVAEWLMSTFQISRAEYRKLAATFNPDKSFANNFATLAKKAGMKYVVITAKHHDGFALFNSHVSDFDIADATPYQGDLIKELYEACLAEGLEFGVYYSHGNDWHDGTDGNYANVKAHNDKLGIYTQRQGKNHWDPSPNTHEAYLQKKAYPQIQELLTLLPKLRIIWFDGDGLITEHQAFDFYKQVYDTNPHVLVNRRVGYQFGDYLDAGDNVIPSATHTLEKHWETVGTTNNSWGFKSYDDDWKSTKELLYYFIDILSKGGNYMLNIGPDGAGHVPLRSAQRLNAMGKWIATNSDAIYGTTRWDIPYEGGNETLLSGTDHRAEHGFSHRFTSNEFWFTAKQNKVYAISLAAPKDTIRILSMRKERGVVSEVRLLGSKKKVSWAQTTDALEIDSRKWEKLENGFVVEVIYN